MGIILIETSSKKIEFGYADENKLLFSETLDPNDNADTLTFYISKAFKKYGLNFKEIEYVSLSNGPGSFTGLRIGSAIAKGICFVNGSHLIEIPTLDIIATKVLIESDTKVSAKQKITSMIFSNMRTMEFYYCEYEFNPGKLKRVSEYKTGLLEDFIENDSIFITNEDLPRDIGKKFHDKIKNASSRSNIPSQLDLTLKYIDERRICDYNLSEPFYMKDFVPKI